MTALAPLQYKASPLRGIELKDSGTRWEVAGYASTWGDPPDAFNDVVQHGAFAASLRSVGSKFLLNHETVIGLPIELHEDSKGLHGRWEILPTTAGRDAHTLAKAGALDALSIGFEIVRSHYRADGVRVLDELTLREVSLVPFGANERALVESVKSRGGTMHDLEAIGRRLAAKGIISLPERRGNLARQIITSVEYRRLLDGDAINSEYQPINTRIELPQATLKALITSIPTVAELATDAQSSSQDTLALLSDRLPSIPTQDSIVQVATIQTAAAAATVAEATSASGASGLKFETGMGWSTVPRFVEQIAAWVPVTRQMLADVAGFEQLLASELTYATRLELERQVLIGDGIRPNLRGLVGHPGVPVVAMGAGGPLDAISAALSSVRLVGQREPNVLVISAASWDAMTSTVTTGTSGPVAGPPALMSDPPTLFGKPVIVSTVLTAGSAVVGASSTAAVYPRTGVVVEMSPHVNSFFLRNMVAVRAELRATFGVTRPSAWATVSGLPT